MRRLLVILALVSLLACVGIIILAVRSYGVGDVLVHKRIEKEGDRYSVSSVALNSTAGRLVLVTTSRSWIIPEKWIMDKHVTRDPPGTKLGWHTWPPQVLLPDVKRSTWGRTLGGYGFTFVKYPYNEPPHYGYDYRIGVPAWLPALLAGILPALWVITALRRMRRRRRARLGLCERYAYDLRESKDRCPECGTPIASRPAEAGISPESPRPRLSASNKSPDFS